MPAEDNYTPSRFGCDNGQRVVEVDAGPVMAGYGMSANAFGVGAARTNGRMDHAYTLSALALMGACRLPDGMLPYTQILSDLIDAPYVGEAVLLFSFSRMPAVSQIQKTEGKIPLLVVSSFITGYSGSRKRSLDFGYLT